jgi:hypothetical protein
MLSSLLERIAPVDLIEWGESLHLDRIKWSESLHFSPGVHTCAFVLRVA